MATAEPTAAPLDSQPLELEPPQVELPAVAASASAEQLGERRSNRKKKGRKARSMRDIRREVRREIAGPLAARRKAGGARRRASSSLGFVSQAPSFLEESAVVREPEPEAERLSRLSASSAFLAELDLSVLTAGADAAAPEEPQEDEFGNPLPQAKVYSQEFMQVLLAATPREHDESEVILDDSEAAAKSVVGPVLEQHVLKPRTGRLSYAREPAPEWWDWDLAGGGVGGRWAPDEPARRPGPPDPAGEQAAEPASPSGESERDELEATLAKVSQRHGTEKSKLRSSALRERLGELSLAPSVQSAESAAAEGSGFELPSIVKGLKLTAEQMEGLKTSFRQVDPEDDGLTCSEFVDFFAPIVKQDSPADLRMLFRKMDASANGQLSCDEFLSYLLHRSSKDEVFARPALLRDLTVESTTGEQDVLLQQFGVKPVRSADGHGSMINRIVAVRMSTGDIPLLYATTGRPGPRGVPPAEPGNAPPETSVMLWRAGDLAHHRTLPASMLTPPVESGIHEDDAVGFLPRKDDNVAALLDNGLLSLDSKDTTRLLGSRRHMLDNTAILVDVIDWPERRAIAVLIDNKLMSPYLSIHRHKDLIGAHAGAKIDRIKLRQMPASPTCFFLCPTARVQPQSPCPNTFLVGDVGGHVSCFRPDGSQQASGKWHKGPVSRVRLITVMRGMMCRVASIGAGEDSRIVLADSATWGVVAKSEPVALGIRALDHSPACSIIVTAGADRTVRVWQDDSLALNEELHGHKATVVDVVVNEAALHFASCDINRCVRVWHLSTYECVQSVADLDPHPPENKLSALLVDMDSNRLVAAGSYLSVWGFEPKPAALSALSPRANAAPEGHSSRVVSVCYSHRFAQCISLCEGGEVFVNEFIARSGTAPRVLEFSTSDGHENSLLSGGTLDVNGSRLFTGSANGLVRLWNTNSGEAMVEEMSAAEQAEFVLRAGTVPDGRRHAPPVEITDLRWLPGSNVSSKFHLMAGGWGAGVMIWKDPAALNGNPMQLEVPPLGRNPAARTQATDVLCTCCAPKVFVAAGTADGRILAWFFRSGDLRMGSAAPKEVITMPAMEGGGAPSPCEMLFWLPAPRALLAIGNGRMHLVSAYSGEVSAPDIDLLPGLCTAAISDDGERLAVGTSKGLVVVYDVTKVRGDTVTRAKAHRNLVDAAGHNRDRGLMVEVGRCQLHNAPCRITALSVCGRPPKKRPKPKPTQSKVKPLPGLQPKTATPESEIEVADIAPTAPDWVLAGCEDGSVFGCSGDGSQCLGLIDSIDLVRMAKEEAARVAAELAAAKAAAEEAAAEEAAAKAKAEEEKKGKRRGNRRR